MIATQASPDDIRGKPVINVESTLAHVVVEQQGDLIRKVMDSRVVRIRKVMSHGWHISGGFPLSSI